MEFPICCGQLVITTERPYGTKSSELVVVVALGIVKSTLYAIYGLSIPQPNSNLYQINDLHVTQND